MAALHAKPTLGAVSCRNGSVSTCRPSEAVQRPLRCNEWSLSSRPATPTPLAEILCQGRSCHPTRVSRPTHPPCRRSRSAQPPKAEASWDFPPMQGDGFSSIPSSTPVFPLRRGSWMLTDCPGVDMVGLRARSNLSKAVYVILFGVGQNDTEGIYSLRAFNEEGLPQETIIVFESEEDCTRYAGLLEATMDHTPAVCSIPPGELMDFCMDAGYQCRLEPCGSLLIPPDHNVCVTDWERSMRLREGQWAVLETEPPAHQQGSGSQQLTCAAVQSPPQAHPLATAGSRRPSAAHASSLAKYHPSFSEDELAEIRLMLETLLPRDDEEGPHGSEDSWDNMGRTA